MQALVYSLNPAGWVACRCLRRFWPGCVTSPLNGLRLREVPVPPLPTEQWVRCRTLLGGICGSDLAAIAQRHPPDSMLQSFSSLPAVLGHENVAVVEAVGAAVDPSWLGKRVCVDPALCCRVRGIEPPCRPCREGQFGACENFSADGEGASGLPPGSCLGYCGPVGGTWSERFVAHVSQLFEPPAALTDEQALLTDPLACSLHAVLRADPPSGQGGLDAAESVLVCGAGVMGLGVVWALRGIGFEGRIHVLARHAHQGDMARRFGADEVLYLPGDARRRFQAVASRTGARLTRARFGNYMLSGGYDVVFECVGSTQSIQEALKWVRSRGRVVLVGTGHGRGADLTPLWFGELTVVGSSGRAEENFRGRRVHTYRLVHELMTRPGPDVSALLTHTFPLSQYRAALEAALQKGPHRSIKVAFRFPADGAAAREQPQP